MYESPIQLYMTDIQTQIIKQQEEQILKAVQSVVVGVDHDELFRALKYDRLQYEKGYQDGKADSTPKWIPVSERLPEEADKYLCNVKSFAFPGCFYHAILQYDKYGFREGHIYTDDVTHWMPLPEPPK